MRADARTERVCMNSNNPTGLLFQKLEEDPGATMPRLEQALEEVGMRDLYEEVLRHI